MLCEWDLDTDRRRFAEQVTAGVRWGGTGGLADRRAPIWSPLAREFADLGRDVLAPPALRAVLDRVLRRAVRAVPGAELAALTLSRPGEPLRTAAASGSAQGARTERVPEQRAIGERLPEECAAALDAVQNAAGPGPFHDATRQDGPGTSVSPDLSAERAWPDFAAAATERGLRGMLCAGVFPVGGGVRGALSVYSAQPRRDAPAEADRLLVLACCAAAALGTTRAIDPAELDRVQIAPPVRSSAVIERAVAVLVDRRGLSATETYDVLRRVCRELLSA